MNPKAPSPRPFEEDLALLEERMKEARFLLRDCQYSIRELKRRLKTERGRP